MYSGVTALLFLIPKKQNKMSEKKVAVTVIKPFRDKEDNANWKSEKTVYETSTERAKVLAEKGFVKINGEEEKVNEKVNQAPTEKNKASGPNANKKK